MAINFQALADTALFGWKGAGSNSTKSYTHTAGGDLVVINSARGETGTADFTATYDGAAVPRVAQIDSGEGITSLFRLSDPGSKTANFVSINGGVVALSQNLYFMRMSGLDSTQPGASIGSEAWRSDTEFSQSATIQQSGSISLVVFNTGSGGSSDIIMDSPLTALTYLENTSGGGCATRVGYVIDHGAGAKTYTGRWVGTADWSRTYVFELLAQASQTVIPALASSITNPPILGGGMR